MHQVFPFLEDKKCAEKGTHVGRFGWDSLLLLYSEWLECPQIGTVTARSTYHEVRTMFSVPIACAIDVGKFDVVVIMKYNAAGVTKIGVVDTTGINIAGVGRADTIGVEKIDVIGIVKIDAISTVKIDVVNVSSIDGLSWHVRKATHCSSNPSHMVRML